jgi:HAE1 family hydrophobic/amphiphilic exporter-1
MHEIAGAIIAITFLMAAVLFQLPLCLVQWEFFIDNLQLRWQLQSFFGIVALTLTPALCAIMLKTIMKAKRKLL